MLPFIYFDFYSHEIGMCRWCISLQGLRPDTSKVRNVNHDDDDGDDDASFLFLSNHHTESRSLWEAKPRVKRGRSKHDDDAIFLYVNRHVLDAESNHYGISHGGQNTIMMKIICLDQLQASWLSPQIYTDKKFLCTIPSASPLHTPGGSVESHHSIPAAGDGIIALLDPSQPTFTRTSSPPTKISMMLDDFGTMPLLKVIRWDLRTSSSFGSQHNAAAKSLCRWSIASKALRSIHEKLDLGINFHLHHDVHTP